MIERFVVVPGWGGSGADHWQQIWAHADARFEVVEQDEWDFPQVDAWVERLDALVRGSDRPAGLVAHSLGCHLVSRWAQMCDTTSIRAAFLVAPPDIEFSVSHGAAAITPFGPVVSAALPFPAVLAASDTDPWAQLDWSSRLASDWGAEFVNLGDCGHVNPDSGHGPWPQGLDRLNVLMSRY